MIVLYSGVIELFSYLKNTNQIEESMKQKNIALDATIL